MRVALHRNFLAFFKVLASAEKESVLRTIRILEEHGFTPGMRRHAVGAFTSVSPNMDLRLLARESGDYVYLLHVDHHEAAYNWANRTALLCTANDACEMLTIANIPEFQVSRSKETHLPIPVANLLEVRDENAFLEAVESLSPEWQEWLIEQYICSNEKSPPVKSSLVFVADGSTSLVEALQSNLPDWRLFLHPSQQNVVEDNSAESMVVTGGPGTGKTTILLNRLLMRSPKGKDAECSVLLTYSKELARELYHLVKAKATTRHFFVFPMYYLAGKKPIKPWKSELANFSLEFHEKGLFVKHHRGGVVKVRELLVDEVQDLPKTTAYALINLIESKFAKVIIAFDSDQAIYHANSEATHDLLEHCSIAHNLTYCYRSTRQILKAATSWQSACGHNTSALGNSALSGPRVSWVECEDLASQVQECEHVILDLERRYNRDSFVLLFGQYFNPSYRGDAAEERAIMKSSILNKYFKHANASKGQEFYSGVVFISQTFLGKALPDKDLRLRVNTLYVALTRFRDEVTVVYQRNCAAFDLLNLAASSSR